MKSWEATATAAKKREETVGTRKKYIKRNV